MEPARPDYQAFYLHLHLVWNGHYMAKWSMEWFYCPGRTVWFVAGSQSSWKIWKLSCAIDKIVLLFGSRIITQYQSTKLHCCLEAVQFCRLCCLIVDRTYFWKVYDFPEICSIWSIKQVCKQEQLSILLLQRSPFLVMNCLTMRLPHWHQRGFFYSMEGNEWNTD